LPDDVARVLERRFHGFIDGLIAQPPRRGLGVPGSR
jgi:hypothetical protein